MPLQPLQLCVGVFWPSMMTMRADYVPEELRSTIINCFRIPLNLFVCLILYNVSAQRGGAGCGGEGRGRDWVLARWCANALRT